MTVPAYHLRANKAVDRFAFIEAIRRLARLDGRGLKGYTYHGLGGPYLEDFRLLYDFYPKIGMVSIENDGETLKRQKFHLPCSSLKLVRGTVSDFLNSYNPGRTKSIFWLDYTELERECFDNFQGLLGMVAPDSMIKVTLPADPDDLLTPSKRRSPEQIDEFYRAFNYLIPDPSKDPPRDPKRFAGLLKEMVQIAAEEALPAPTGDRRFVPVSSFYYSDGRPMFTLAGVVCRGDREAKLREAFADWEHASLTWEESPKQINMPILSTKERLSLQESLPLKTSAKALRDILGYVVDPDPKMKNALEQYAIFHRYEPYFLRGVP